MELIILIHKFEDGGARFAMPRDGEEIDWDYWCEATTEEATLWCIMRTMREPSFRDVMFAAALADWDRDPGGMANWIRFIGECDEGKHTLPARGADHNVRSIHI